MGTRKCHLCGRTAERKTGFKETDDGLWRCSDREACAEERSRCWLCGGNGIDPHFSINTCPECRGSGYSRMC